MHDDDAIVADGNDGAILFAVVACNAESPMQALPDVAKPGEGGYVRGELIYPLDNTPTPQCHASTIEETTPGFVAAWFRGNARKNKDVGIWVSRLEDNAWSEPVEVAVVSSLLIFGIHVGIPSCCNLPMPR